MHWKMVVLLLPLCCANLAMWECYCIATALPLLLSQVLSLPLSLNPTVSVVAPVAANTAFLLATLIATHTGADVTVVGILPNNLLLSASLAVIHYSKS